MAAIIFNAEYRERRIKAVGNLYPEAIGVDCRPDVSDEDGFPATAWLIASNAFHSILRSSTTSEILRSLMQRLVGTLLSSKSYAVSPGALLQHTMFLR